MEPKVQDRVSNVLYPIMLKTGREVFMRIPKYELCSQVK